MIEVAIPMRDCWELTAAVVATLSLHRQYDVCRVFDNGSVAERSLEWLERVDGTHGVEVVRRPRASLYRMWNEAMFEVAEPGALVCVLNNDVRVGAGFVGYLTQAMVEADPDVWVVYPDWRLEVARQRVSDPIRVTPTWGTRNSGGMSGFAFMVDTDALVANGVPPIDENFEWVSGDGDLVTQVERAGGRCGRVEGLACEHEGGATARHHPWTRRAAARDRQYRRTKYGQP